MADVTGNEDGQLMLLTVFMILIGVVGYTAILNNMIFSANLQSTGLEGSKQEIRDFRLLTEAEVIKAAYYANTTPPVNDPANQTQVRDYFYNHMTSFNETVTKIYSAKGASVEILINNVSLNRTAANMTVKKYYVESKNHTFKIGSLVIPMDDNQVQPQSKTMKVYGLIYRIVDDKGTQPLNQTQIPVWTILQNPVNDSVPNFSITLTTNATTADGTILPRVYSGGPFIVDNDDLNETRKNWILDEASKNNITVHELKEEFYYERCVQMVVPPKVAIYPIDDASQIAVMETYYKHGDVPYTALNDTQIQNGILNDFDILTIPHHDMRTEPVGVINAIVGWVANGGILHVHCYGTWTMDKAVETSLLAGPAKPWYGFIGVNDTDNGDIDEKNLTYGRFVDKNSSLNATYRLNSTPLVPLSGLADPGSPFSPLAQSSNRSGMMTWENGLTELFTLRNNASQINPATNILAYAAYSNNWSNWNDSLVYADFDDPRDRKKEAQLIYAEAPYENGLVSYLAGHNQSERVGGERLIFENFFAASMRTQLYSAITAKNINMTIKYFDGNVRYTDTFIINI